MPARNPERLALLTGTAAFCGVSRATLFGHSASRLRPRALRRADRGQPRKLPAAELERWCEVIAALKLRTTSEKSRPFEELAYPNAIRAKLAIADLLGRLLARLSDEERAWINGLLAETLAKAAVLARVRQRFLAPQRTSAGAAGHIAAAARAGTEEEGVPG